MRLENGIFLVYSLFNKIVLANLTNFKLRYLSPFPAKIKIFGFIESVTYFQFLMGLAKLKICKSVKNYAKRIGQRFYIKL